MEPHEQTSPAAQAQSVGAFPTAVHSNAAATVPAPSEPSDISSERKKPSPMRAIEPPSTGSSALSLGEAGSDAVTVEMGTVHVWPGKTVADAPEIAVN